MKKLIATSAVALSLVFAFALANAEDTSISSPSGSTSSSEGSMSGSEAGTVGSESETAMPGVVGSTTEPARKAKTCVDKAGSTYRMGQKGYERCMSEKAQAKAKEQSGRVHETKEKIEKSTDETSKSTGESSTSEEGSLGGSSP